MKTEEELIWEAYNNDLYWLYHGGAKWNHFDAQIRKPSKNRYEAGAGIYLTNSYETARKYAKGSKVVSKVGIIKNLIKAEDVKIKKSDVINFLKTYISPKFRKLMLGDLDRVKGDYYPAYYLINLSVNYEVGGKNALYINNFIVEHGVDISIQKQSGDEIWVVVHNPKIIKKVIHTKPSDIKLDDYTLKTEL